MTEASGPPPSEPTPDEPARAPDPEQALEPASPPTTAPPAPPLQSTRRLLGASFDLLTATSSEMRRASFYIGIIVLCTVGPFALASWALEVASQHLSSREVQALLIGVDGQWFGVLGVLVIICSTLLRFLPLHPAVPMPTAVP